MFQTKHCNLCISGHFYHSVWDFGAKWFRDFKIRSQRATDNEYGKNVLLPKTFVSKIISSLQNSIPPSQSYRHLIQQKFNLISHLYVLQEIFLEHKMRHCSNINLPVFSLLNVCRKHIFSYNLCPFAADIAWWVFDFFYSVC